MSNTNAKVTDRRFPVSLELCARRLMRFCADDYETITDLPIHSLDLYAAGRTRAGGSFAAERETSR